jgi:hypothetical protein
VLLRFNAINERVKLSNTVSAAYSGRGSDDGLKGDAYIQEKRVIVNVHREQARSYNGAGFTL